MDPQVSVLMPAYNAAQTIVPALDSILRQTLMEIELVAVDDGSTDNTPAILDAYASRDPRVKLVHSDHRGIVVALNAGIAQCQAPFIARMDADDISHPSRLELQLHYMMTHPDIAVCSCLVRLFPRRGLLGGLIHYENWINSLIKPEDIARDIFVESPMSHPSVMLRRDDLVAIGGYQDHGWAEDYDLWLRYSENGKLFGKVERTLVWWRHAAGRLTFTDSRYSLENFLRAKAHYLSRRFEGSQRPIILWGAGMIGRRILRHLIREGVDIRAVVDIDREKIGRTVRGKPIMAREQLQEMDNPFVIAAVGSSTAREKIRTYLAAIGLAELSDFICAA